jgi:hypothetical protein
MFALAFFLLFFFFLPLKGIFLHFFELENIISIHIKDFCEMNCTSMPDLKKLKIAKFL